MSDFSEPSFGKVVEYFKTLRAYARGSARFVRQVEGDIRDGEPLPADEVRWWCRAALNAAVVVTVVCGLLVPVALPLLLTAVLNPPPNRHGAVSGLFIGPAFSLVLVMLYPLVGVAGVLAVAPSRFYRTRAGRRWMELIGTKGVSAARVVCAVLVTVGVVCVVGSGAVQYLMMTGPLARRQIH